MQINQITSDLKIASDMLKIASEELINQMIEIQLKDFKKIGKIILKTIIACLPFMVIAHTPLPFYMKAATSLGISAYYSLLLAIPYLKVFLKPESLMQNQ